MSATNNSGVPIKVLVLALGGEGGGVLGQWLVEAGIALGHAVQASSIPGVAQRTGATSYYLEWVPVARTQLAGQEPVLCLSPMAGDIDLLVSSELLETARAVERGLPAPARTLVLTSTSRTHTVAEKMVASDGRLTAEALRARVSAGVEHVVGFDMQAKAREAGTVISAVMFGAIFASARLPLSRDVCEQVIRAGARGVEASLRGFELGVQAYEYETSQGTAEPKHAFSSVSLKRDPAAPAVSGDGSEQAYQDMLAIGMARLRDYQDQAYADSFRDRVSVWAALEREQAMMVRDASNEPLPGNALPVTTEAARQLARWMAFEDVIRVADLKIRRSRYQSIEDEATSGQGGIVRTWDYLKPGWDEIVALLPPALARRVAAFAERRGWRALGNGLTLETTGVFGMLLMRALAMLRPWRRHGARFADEHAMIARWDAALQRALRSNQELAASIAEAPSVIKGYSDTHARGYGRFVQLLEHCIEPAVASMKPAPQVSVPDETPSDTPAMRDAADRARSAKTAPGTWDAQKIRKAVEIARQDVQGIALANALGLTPPEPIPQPIRFLPRRQARPSTSP